MRRIIWMIIQGRYLVSNECNIWIKIFFCFDRLLPYYSEYPNIRKLIDQCDLEAMRRCSTVPALQLYQTPGEVRLLQSTHFG